MKCQLLVFIRRGRPFITSTTVLLNSFPGSLSFPLPGDGKKRDPGNEVAVLLAKNNKALGDTLKHLLKIGLSAFSGHLSRFLLKIRRSPR